MKLLDRELYGVKSDVSNSVTFLDDDVVVYPAGHNVVLYNAEEKVQKILNGSDTSEAITAMAVCPSKRFIAVAEKSERGIVNIFDLKTLKKRKVLTASNSSSTHYVDMAFSSDNQLMLTMTAGPNWMLSCWNWSKAKILASVSCAPADGSSVKHQQVTKCTFSILDPSVVCCTGDQYLKFFRIVDQVFRPMPPTRLEMVNFRCHVWIPQKEDQILIGTIKGDLLLFQAGEFKCRLSTSPGGDRSVEHIAVTGKGFICGCDDASLHFYDVLSEKQAKDSTKAEHGILFRYRMDLDDTLTSLAGGTVHSLSGVNTGASNTLAKQNAIRCIAVSPNEESIILTLLSLQMVVLPYNNLGSSMLPSNGAETAKITSVEHLLTPFHRPGDSGRSSISGLDVCLQKPLVVTCGEDKTIRVWNYGDANSGRKCEVVKQFIEEAYSVSFHPSGFHLLVGFVDKLRLMNILMDDVRSYKEFPIKSCRVCKFSNGGHMFAAANGNMVQIYSFYTCELITTLRGHNGKVKSLHWNSFDTVIISAGVDGALYQWQVEDSKRLGEYIQKCVLFTSVIANKEESIVYAAGSDHTIKEIEFPSGHIVKEVESSKLIGHVLLSHSQRFLFAATVDSDRPGSVRVYQFPLTEDFVEYACLSSAITQLCISLDDTTLFAVGEDGAFCIFNITEKGSLQHRKIRAGLGGIARSGQDATLEEVVVNPRASDEILVTRTDLEEKQSQMLELKSKVEELTLHNEYQMRLKDMTYNEKLKEVTDEFSGQVDHERNQFEILREEKNDMQMEFEEQIKSMDENHQEKVQELESHYQQLIMKEVEQYQQAASTSNAQNNAWEQQQNQVVHSHEQYVSDVTEDFEQKLDEDRQLRIQMEDENEQWQEDYKESQRQLEQDLDVEIEQLRKKYKDKVAVEREATLRFKGENGIMKKKFSALQKEIEDQREEVKSLLGKEKGYYTSIQCLEKEIQQYKRTIRSRDEIIGDKEKKIYELKKKNQELEKFKFVLDYKIKELKRQIEPRENEIQDMKAQIHEMDEELEQFHMSNGQLDQMIGELRAHLNTRQIELVDNRKAIRDNQRMVRSFRCDIYETIQYIQNPTELRSRAEMMESKYLHKHNSTTKAGSGRNEDEETEFQLHVQDEYKRQREFLEKTVKALKKQMNLKGKQYESENVELMNKNMTLIKEMNTVRGSLQVLKGKVQTLRATSIRAKGTNQQSTRIRKECAEKIDKSNKIIESQQDEIKQLRDMVQRMESQVLEKLDYESVSKANKGLVPPTGSQSSTFGRVDG